jgi:hypothetical protein
MKRADDLTHEQLVEIVNELQRSLYLDEDDDGELILNPNKDLNGSDFIAEVENAIREWAPELIPCSIVPMQENRDARL